MESSYISTAMLILVIGDVYIPTREFSIPEQFISLFKSGKIDKVVSVGNASDAYTAAVVQSIVPKPSVISVCGEFDVPSGALPTQQTFNAGKRKIGLVSGFMVTPAGDMDVLTTKARSMDADVLLYGGTHQQDVNVCSGYGFVNPGSLTGASNPKTWTSDDIHTYPGFCLLDVSDESTVAYMYQLQNGNVVVNKASLPLRALPEA